MTNKIKHVVTASLNVILSRKVRLSKAPCTAINPMSGVIVRGVDNRQQAIRKVSFLN